MDIRFCMEKKKTLVISLVMTIIFITLLFATRFGICPPEGYVCEDALNPIAQVISIFFPVFLLALITYKMRVDVYRVWFRFARWWVPLSIFATLITPTTHDWLYPLASKAGVAFLSPIFFFIVSLLLIAWKYLSMSPNWKDKLDSRD